jgi:hypothetical protein
MTALAPVAAGTIDLPRRLEKPLLLLFGGLASTLLLKIAGVQYLEIIEFLLVLYLGLRLVQNSFRVQLSGVLYRLGIHYAVLTTLISLGALLALGRPVYAETTGLYGLGILSASRLLELVLDVTAMIVLAEIFRHDRTKCFFTMRAYFWTGTLSATIGVVATLAHLSISSAAGPLFTANGRANGFFNEGGPLGLYLISNIAVGWMLALSEDHKLRIAIMLAMIPNALALILSASKAAYVAIGFMILLQALFASSLRQRVAVAIVFVIGVVLVLRYTPVATGFQTYTSAADEYVTLSNLNPTNYNLVAGRVAGIFLVPRMIAAHPWTGVGLANYGLVRNALEYRGGSVWVTIADSPGLGLAGMVAEIGIPLSIYLLYVLFLPFTVARRAIPWTPLISLVLVQPVVHLFGAQLNLTYPWITTAFALGLVGAGVTANTSRPHQTGTDGDPSLHAESAKGS